MNLLKKILSFLWLLPICFRSNIKIRKVILYNTTVNVSDGSNVSIYDSNVVNDIIVINGNNNSLDLASCSLSNSRIIIEGDNCKLIFQEGTKINKSKLVIRGKNCTISIGKNSTIGSGEFICMGIDNKIDIGERCMIADDVDIWATDSHPITDLNTGQILNGSLPIKIDDHVWIGKGATVLKGVNIGENSVVGMKSVVTHDIEPSCIYVGIPAKKVKESINWDRNFIRQ